MTDPPASLAAAIVALQADLPRIGKDKTARVTSQRTGRTHTYDYADLATVSAKILPLLSKHGLAFIATPEVLEDGKFVLGYELLHIAGDSRGGSYPLPAGGTPQDIGSAITYARRYCLCAVTGVAPDGDDDDAQAAEETVRKPRSSRGKPPERAAANLPRNLDGTVSRSQSTDEELAAAGLMTDAQQREHTQLRNGATTGKPPRPTERSTEADPDDPWQGPPLRTPRPAGNPIDVIMMHFKRLGVEDREERLGYTSLFAGRQIDSTKELTAAEGAAVIRKLGSLRDHEALVATNLEGSKA